MELKRIRVDQINIGSRLREDLGDLDELATRMKARKMAAPIAVKLIKGTNSYKLLAGYRRLRAVRDKLNESMIWAMVLEPQCELEELLIERDENFRKDYNPIEMAKLGQKIEDLIGNRQGQGKAKGQLRDGGPEVGQRTREFAADAAGFESDSAYRKAKSVVANGTPELQEAVTDGTVSVSDAAAVAKEKPAVQDAAVKKVRKRKAKTVTEAVQHTSDADEEAKPQLDCLKNPVPEDLRDVFEQVEEFRSIMHALATCKSRVLELGKHQAGGWIDQQDTERMIQQAHAHLRFAMPYTECPKCRRKTEKKCKACKGTGWINESMFGSCASDADKRWLEGGRS